METLPPFILQNMTKNNTMPLSYFLYKYTANHQTVVGFASTSNITENLRKKTHIFAPSIFFLHDIPKFPYFLFCLENFYSFRVGLQVKTFLFLHVRISFMSEYHFWKLFSLDVEFWIDSLFFQPMKNMPLLGPLVSEELAAILIAVHLERMCHFAWRFFFYGFSFESDRDRPWHRFLWVYFISGSLRILNLNLYVVLPNSGNYWPLFLECFLFPEGIL